MTAIYIILGIIAFIILLLICPIKIFLVYDGELRLKVGYLFLRFTVLPKKEKPDDKPETQKKSQKKSGKKQENKDGGQEKKKNPILEFKDKHGLGEILGLVKSLLDILTDIPKRLAKHLIIKMLDIKVLAVGDDSSDTAIKYGYACSLIYPIVSILENNLKIKRHNVEIVAGFLAEEAAAEFTLSAYVKPLFLIGTGISAFFKFVSAIAKIK